MKTFYRNPCLRILALLLVHGAAGQLVKLDGVPTVKDADVTNGVSVTLTLDGAYNSTVNVVLTPGEHLLLSECRLEFLPGQPLSREIKLFPGDGVTTTTTESTFTYGFDAAVYAQDGIIVGGAAQRLIVNREFVPRSQCMVTGDPHILTFDGKWFDYFQHGWSDYVVTEETRIQMLGVVCIQDPEFLCAGALAVRHGSQIMTLFVNNTGEAPNPVVQFNDAEAGYILVSDNLAESGHPRFRVTLKDGAMLDVDTMSFSAGSGWFLNIAITVPGSYATRTSGVCGNFNGIIEDDVETFEPLPPAEQCHDMKCKAVGYEYKLNCLEKPRPVNPEVPETPKVPEVPETPGVPQVPKTPETPETPETPGVPEVPQTPETPDFPTTAVTETITTSPIPEPYQTTITIVTTTDGNTTTYSNLTVVLPPTDNGTLTLEVPTPTEPSQQTSISLDPTPTPTPINVYTLTPEECQTYCEMVFRGAQCGPNIPADYFVKSCALDAAAAGSAQAMVELGRYYLDIFKSKCREETKMLLKSPIQQDQAKALEIVKDCGFKQPESDAPLEEVKCENEGEPSDTGCVCKKGYTGMRCEINEKAAITSIMGDQTGGSSSLSISNVTVAIVSLLLALCMF